MLNGIKMSKKFRMFHISDKYLGDDITMTPRVPSGQSLSEIHSKYKLIPRICCSDTIEKCLAGITKLKIKEEMYVYELKDRKVQIDWDSPRDCCDDWELTDEVWLIEPAKFKYVKKILPNTNIFDNEYTYKTKRG